MNYTLGIGVDTLNDGEILRLFDEIKDSNYTTRDLKSIEHFDLAYRAVYHRKRKWVYEAIPDRILMRLTPEERLELVDFGLRVLFDVNTPDYFVLSERLSEEWYRTHPRIT